MAKVHFFPNLLTLNNISDVREKRRGGKQEGRREGEEEKARELARKRGKDREMEVLKA